MPWSRLKVCKKNQRAKFRKTFNQLISSRAKLSFERWAWGWKRRKHDPRKTFNIDLGHFFVLLAVRMKVGTQRAAAPLFVATVAAANGFYADTQFTAAHHHGHHHQQQHCLHHRCNPCNLIFTQISNSQNCRSSKLIETIFLLGERARQ